MRSENEMMDLILSTARNDERIRAVILNGSRANPAAPRDPFQDFDIVYIVTELAPYRNNPAWASQFGEFMVMQMPDAMGSEPLPQSGGTFAYLMQFQDGNRIDLTLCPLAELDQHLGDSLSVLLLDKDGILPPFPPPSDRDYLPKPPSAKAFSECCNEFWWVSPYVAKGLWRGEITYAKHLMGEVIRGELMRMLTWQIGIDTQFQINPGKSGKYFKNYLKPALWERLLSTYADADYTHTWASLTAACDLFRISALYVAGHYGFAYPNEDDTRVCAHLAHVQTLPKDAVRIY